MPQWTSRVTENLPLPAPQNPGEFPISQMEDGRTHHEVRLARIPTIAAFEYPTFRFLPWLSGKGQQEASVCNAQMVG